MEQEILLKLLIGVRLSRKLESRLQTIPNGRNNEKYIEMKNLRREKKMKTSVKFSYVINAGCFFACSVR